MPDIIRMMTDMSSPDSLRQLLQLSKKFYDLHTKKYYGNHITLSLISFLPSDHSLLSINKSTAG